MECTRGSSACPETPATQGPFTSPRRASVENLRILRHAALLAHPDGRAVISKQRWAYGAPLACWWGGFLSFLFEVQSWIGRSENRLVSIGPLPHVGYFFPKGKTIPSHVGFFFPKEKKNHKFQPGSPTSGVRRAFGVCGFAAPRLFGVCRAGPCCWGVARGVCLVGSKAGVVFGGGAASVRVRA